MPGRRSACLGSVLISLLFAITPSPAIAQTGPTATLRIQGTTTLSLQASREVDDVVIQGHLIDDSGRGVAEATIEVSAPGEETARLPDARTCDGADTLPPSGQGNARHYLVRTDRQGRFCITTDGPVNGREIAARYTDAAKLYASASATTGITASAERPPKLRFSPAPTQLDLGRRIHSLYLEIEPQPGLEVGDEIPLELLLAEPHLGEKGLQSLVGVVGERTAVELDSPSLGPPGAATLLVRRAGSTQVLHRAVIQRVVRVQLSVAERAEDDPHRVLQVGVGSALGAVPRGSVEAVYEGHTVGIAPVAEGSADLRVEPHSRATERVPVELRYIPDSPWWQPGDPLEVMVQTTSPWPWRGMLWAFAATTLVVWLASLHRRAPARPKLRRDPLPRVTGRPGVAFTPSSAGQGWKGTVLDAHEGTPVAGCLLRVVPPQFDSAAVYCEATSATDGSFSLPSPGHLLADGTELHAMCTGYSTLVQALPGEGTLLVSVVTRRRALLIRLVAWARRRAGPYQLGGEATPGQVAAAAVRLDDKAVEVWAGAVERKAFGVEPPTEGDERELVEREPSTTAP